MKIGAASCILAITNNIVSASSTYTFTFRPTATSASAKNIQFIKLIFSQASTIIPPSPLTCALGAQSSGQFSGSPNCVAGTDGTSQTIWVSNLISGQSSYQFTVTMTNPLYSLTVSDTKCISCSSSSSQASCTTSSGFVESASATASSFKANTINPCTYCSLKSSSIYNGVITATMTFKIVTVNPVAANGALRLLLANSNYNFRSMGAPAANGFTTQNNPYSATLTASFGTPGSLSPTLITIGTTVFNADSTGEYIDTLIIQFTNSPQIATGQQITITIYPCTNPPSTQPVSNFEVHTGYYVSAQNQFYATDQFQALTLTTTTSAQITSGSLTPQGGLTMVSQTSVTYLFSFFATNDIPLNGYIKIFPPTSMNLNCVTQASQFSIVSVATAQGSTACTGIFCDPTDNSLQIQGCFTAEYFYATQQFDIYINGFTNPATATTIYFTLTSYSLGASVPYSIDTSSSLFYFTPSLGVITINSVVPSTSEIYDSSGSYKFNLRCQHEIATSYQLYITFPNTFSIIQSSACTVTGLGTSYSCAASSSGLQIVLGTLQSYTISAGTNLVFTVNSIMNPGIYSAPGTIQFNLVSVTASIDSGSYIMPSGLYVMSNIQTFTVQPGSYQCGATNVAYKFTVIPAHRVSQSAYLTLSLPSDISITDISQMTQLCPNQATSGFPSTYIQCTYNSVTGLISIKYGFFSSASSGNPPTLIFYIPALTNPRTLQTTGMFNVSIFDNNNQLLYRYNTSVGPTVQMTTTNTPSSMYYERSSYQNGVINDYTFTINPYSLVYSGDTFTFTLPQSVRFTTASQVIGNSFYISSTQSSTFSGDLQSVVMTVRINTQQRRSLVQKSIKDIFDMKRNLQTTNFIPQNSFISIILTNITSASSLRPESDSIKFVMKSSTGFLYESLSSGLTIQNQVTGTFSSSIASVQPNYFEKSALANYTFSFKPVNYERNMQIWVIVPSGLYVPDGYYCEGLKGTDSVKLTCNLDRSTNTIVITDAVTQQPLAPNIIIFQVISIQNPSNNIVTDSFIFQTYTYDNYQIDQLSSNLSINFFCIYPCKECNLSQPSQCYSCYPNGTSKYFLLYNSQCLSDCDDGQYKLLNVQVPTCDFCKSPCQTCDKTNQTCMTCIPGYALYSVDNTCYKIINWYFPFLCAAALSLIVVILTDTIKRSTEFLHSYLFFLSILEIGALGYIVWLYFLGEVLGNRYISVVTLGTFALLNIIFIPVHQKLIINQATPEYSQVLQQYKISSYIILSISYIFNFKLQVLLVSKFGALPRFSGRYNSSNWMKFNIFGILYIILVYLPFMADFYLYFTQYGLRQITTFVAIEAAGIMTIITLILLLELMNQCACIGMNEQDLGKRAGLIDDMKNQGKKKKRKADRDGMGNEDSYGSMYGSEQDFHDDGQKIDEDSDEDDYYDEEEEDEVDENEDGIDSTTKKKTRGGKNQKQLDMLEDLAKQMKDQRSKIEEEKQRVLNEKLKLLKEKEKYFKDANALKEDFDKDRQKMMQELTNLDNQKEELKETVDQRIDEKLAANKPALVLPQPIFDFIVLEKGLDGDDEYWLQNATPRAGMVSDRSAIKEKDASEIDYLSKTEGKASYLGDGRKTVEDFQEMRANISQGPEIGEANSIRKSINATEMEFINKSQGIFGASETGKGLNKNATQEMLGERNFEGTELENYDKKSAVFGDLSDLIIDATQRDFIDKSDAAYEAISKHKSAIEPMMDQGGRSSESSEGIVADHAPFKGIKEAMENQEKLRRQQIDSDDSAEEEQRPQERRRIKQVLYSDKSESSVDDMMEDTPSNYNIANGRLEGKSMGLKAILLFAKNQGINIGAGGRNIGALPQIQEEQHQATPQDGQMRGMNSSGDAGHWRPMNNPLQGLRGTQIVGTEEFGRQIGGTIEHDGSKPSKNKNRSNRNPGLQKQFKEPGDEEEDDSQELSKIKKNNFI